MKNKKIYIMLVVSILFTVIGVSLAYFSLNIIGNDTAKYNTITTGDLALTYTDTSELSFDNALPGDSITKTITVKNTGTEEASYNLVWQELTNTITNDELAIEATCKRLNSSNTEEGTCDAIAQTPIKSNTIKKNISIEPNVTHEYTIKVTFLDTGEPQNYNKNKSFTGTLGINEYKLASPVAFSTDEWDVIVNAVKTGNTSVYNLGDTKEIDMGTYGTHTIRIANMSTPAECNTEGFSQTACGFVLEFVDLITKHAMNPNGTYNGKQYDNGCTKDGWPASEMYTFVNTNIYNALPSELRNVIIDTVTVSGHGSEDTENFTSIDKLYLLDPKEIYTDFSDVYDTAKDLTRTLDYYTVQGVTTKNYSGASKTYDSNAYQWWFRSAISYNPQNFYTTLKSGLCTDVQSHYVSGVSPAFRLGNK